MTLIAEHKTNTQTLSAERLFQLQKVFDVNKWDDDQLFDDFCKLLSKFSSDQQDMLIDLTQGFFFREDTGWYLSAFKHLLTQLEESNSGCFKRVFIMPLLHPNRPKRETKSGDFCSYLFKQRTLLRHSFLVKKKVTQISSPDGLPPKFIEKHCLLVLVDDFVGSGETGADAVKRYIEIGIPAESIAVLAIVGQLEGINKIKAEGVKVFCKIQRDKGITDNFPSPTKERYCELMREIEKQLNVQERYSFGYGSSEALVSLARTPNNTFPVFWFKDKNDMDYTPPFER